MTHSGTHHQAKRGHESSLSDTSTISTKKRKTRWGPASTAAKLAGLQTAITAAMTAEQISAYAMHVRIEKITQKLRIDDVVPADRDRRSPSPEPQYDASGKRTNTRYRRRREMLESERDALVEAAKSICADYRAPLDYVHGRGRPRCRVEEKVYIPVHDFPEVNFIGQLLGPRGRSMNDMKAQSEAFIAIRGRGSVKDGKSREAGGQAGYDHLREPLHCFIAADSQCKVDKAKMLIQNVIETATTVPEGSNDRKRQQLRDLAVVNGTFRDDEGGRGEGSDSSVLARVVCRTCSGSGHIARDCSDRTKSVPWRKAPWHKEESRYGAGDDVDAECLQLLSEVQGIM